MSAVTAYGLLAYGVIFGALAALLPFGEWRARASLAATTIALLGGIAPVMHGVFGTPSLTLLQLALLQLADRTPSPLGTRPALGLLIFVAIFYPLALGLGGFDPYAPGYQPWPLLIALVPVALALWWRRLDNWMIILSVDLAGYATGIFANLWDVLFDPLLVLLALIVVIRQRSFRFIVSRNR